ncbi:N-methylhydantoinase A/oxoprolinase/acetone carboxylase, beta subunit [Micromonospora rhizosphaerae]|uniref:N-methylhydantoinase A/oxoprolinase/acetone carboxylase, beta subunit n=1 Tax=Micromonospora rhizosphaerae TaxID=568872 RepID=A0A1C6T4B4_9ACTN|nr:hydantoinase/oxoprolinase family protein [Micromonospora rhizosphaerae]SCL36412.1 N-methylhydantoinase A/oxoprolinase/acetone carboxylase, beta subunit [Micromonospora rhizosphaerae]
MRIGIDVGGTNTDAVLMDGAELVCKVKTRTTSDVMSGITDAIGTLLDDANATPDVLLAVMIGTTHFTNAVITQQGLAPTAVIRLGLPATQAVEPLEDWPGDLRAAVGGSSVLVHGGNEFDGRELSALDPDELRSAVRKLVDTGVESIALSAVFSPISPEMERRAARIIQDAAPGLSITLSHEVGRLGLLERENAAAINASLRPLARRTVAAFRRSLVDRDIKAPLYLTQNDGTLMLAETAEKFPVLTFASGPTNSIRGAAFLSGYQDALVMDVGGSTADVGALAQGFPRASSVNAMFAGLRTSFRMPDLISIALGGGTVVVGDQPAIGPTSVGHAISEQAVVFGGGTLTATDLAVAGGLTSLGDSSRVADLDPGLVARGLSTMRAMMEETLDRMKLARGDEPVIVVGGGSVLVPGELKGISDVIRPEHFEVANAVGAAIAQVSGEVDQIMKLDAGREEILGTAQRLAFDRARANGADGDSLRVVEVEEIPLPYLEKAMTRVRVKVVGDLAMTGARV